MAEFDMALSDIIKINRKNKPKAPRGGAANKARGAGQGPNTPQQAGKVQKKKKNKAKNVNNQNQGATRGVQGAGRGQGGISNKGGRGGGQVVQRNPSVQRNQPQPQMKNVPMKSAGPAKMTITNLDFGVTDADIKELFGEFGAIRGAGVHYDSSGRSIGSAHVHFTLVASAHRAQSQYNGVKLDGRPMKITVEGPKQPQTNPVQSKAKPVKRLSGAPTAAKGTGPQQPKKKNKKKPAANANQANNAPAQGAAKKKKAKAKKPVKKQPTVAELDAELEAYVASKTL